MQVLPFWLQMTFISSRNSLEMKLIEWQGKILDFIVFDFNLRLYSLKFFFLSHYARCTIVQATTNIAYRNNKHGASYCQSQEKVLELGTNLSSVPLVLIHCWVKIDD